MGEEPMRMDDDENGEDVNRPFIGQKPSGKWGVVRSATADGSGDGLPDETRLAGAPSAHAVAGTGEATGRPEQGGEAVAAAPALPTWQPLCRTDVEYDLLMEEAGRQCTILRHVHRIHHCAEGLGRAELAMGEKWGREWTEGVGWVHRRA